MSRELGATQHALLRLLLHNKAGMTVEALTESLGVTRNAVRQHLSALERDGAVSRGPTQPSGGRPEQLYVITQEGLERFPRQYSWFSEILMETLRAQLGQEGTAERLNALGRGVGEQLRADRRKDEALADRLKAVSGAMAELGYEAEAREDRIEAQNCVFHLLAQKFPEICRFDLGLLEAATGRPVDQESCMARGDGKCCFRFGAKNKS
jgi:predicted ArsR family transcriptional regulator